MQIFAQKKNCIISIRPVNLMAIDLIRDGHLTKEFKCKREKRKLEATNSFYLCQLSIK
ncbi:anthrax toxin-like adenylyl cyclase domain-containing protein [Candidatus Williamhamiltonella defendens]|uniref:anthrax toxin-like adenylyl cyclase domain-containing protein n=1 Tax=Candidatus Williamhamiltonella defendens TaxID=138072 RepID=UPI0022A79C14|nr:anthrax toxin-like adenylyl cyclase domain-containing protein [Candidatus Hamiltonella defensa]